MNEKTFSKFNGYVVKDAQARNDIKSINNEITTINNNANTTNRNVETNKTNIDVNAKAITTLNNNIGVINSTIDTLDSSVRSITADNESINNRMDDINETFDNLGDIANNAGIINEKIDANTTKINEVEESLNNISYVDNLITDDDTKGLAARQGKVLNEKIDTLENTVNEKTTKDIITLVQATDSSYTLSNSAGQKLPLTLHSKVGVKLTYSNNGILVGSGVSKIKLNATFLINCDSAKDIGIAIYATGSDSTRKNLLYTYDMTNANANKGLSFTNAIVEVAEGDLISCEGIVGYNSTTFKVKGKIGTYLCSYINAEVIE